MKLDKEKLIQFLLKARTKTYAGKGEKVKPSFTGSTQREYKEGAWFYRDVYYTGPQNFYGLEVVYHQNRPIWAMSYCGSFKDVTEKELDKILRKALMENWQSARIWKKVEWKRDEYKYICQPDFKGSIDNLAGVEKIFRKRKEIYRFYYAGGILI